jgi:hypothetical protein
MMDGVDDPFDGSAVNDEFNLAKLEFPNESPHGARVRQLLWIVLGRNKQNQT